MWMEERMAAMFFPKGSWITLSLEYDGSDHKPGLQAPTIERRHTDFPLGARIVDGWYKRADRLNGNGRLHAKTSTWGNWMSKHKANTRQNSHPQTTHPKKNKKVEPWVLSGLAHDNKHSYALKHQQSWALTPPTPPKPKR